MNSETHKEVGYVDRKIDMVLRDYEHLIARRDGYFRQIANIRTWSVALTAAYFALLAVASADDFWLLLFLALVILATLLVLELHEVHQAWITDDIIDRIEKTFTLEDAKQFVADVRDYELHFIRSSQEVPWVLLLNLLGALKSRRTVAWFLFIAVIMFGGTTVLA